MDKHQNRALIVDDDAGVAQTVAEAAAGFGYEARYVTSPEEALGVVREWLPDVLITDMYMKEMNGVQLAEAVRAIQPRTVCHLFSGYVTPSTRHTVSDGLFDGLFAKPGQMLDLLRTLQGSEAPPDDARPTDEAPPSRQWGRVLVVEDHAGVRETVSEVCESMGLTVETAGDGREACAKAEEQKYDVIFMDLHLPHMGGVDAISVIRQANPRTFVVAMSGEATRAERDKARLAGAYTCLAKPFEISELRETVERMHRIARQRRTLHSNEARRAEKLRKTAWRRRWQRVLTKRTAVIVGLVLLGVGLSIAGALLLSNTTSVVADQVRQGTSFMERVEGYLSRDEQRELQRQRR